VSCGASLATAPRVQPGTVLGRRYHIQKVLGAGGMGMVFEAYDRELEETVAVKVLRMDLAASENMARRFRTEIKLARRVRHRNVCGIHEYGSDGAINYIAMELIRGTDLKRLVREKGALRAEEAFDVCIQIAEGLQAIHDAGIIHRDLKTSNVMLDSKGRVALMDFGIAKDTQQSVALGATAVGQLIGTPEYMSPEQARGERLDTRSDLYALGIIVFEVFSGHVPFQGTTPIATLFKNLEELPPLQGEKAAGIPRPVIPVLAKALAKQPAERHQSAREAAEALRAARIETLGPGHAQNEDRTGTLTMPAGTAHEPPTLVSPSTAVPPHTVVLPQTAVPPETLVTRAPAPAVPRPPPPPRSPRAPALRQGVPPAAVLGGLIAAVVGVALVGLLIPWPPWPSPSPSVVPSAAPSASDAPLPTPVPMPTPALPSAAPSATAAPVATPTAPPRPAQTPTPTPTPTPTQAAPVSVTVPVAPPEPPPEARPPVTRPPAVTTRAAPQAARAPASLQIRVRPWAEVSVDGEVVGTTPFAPLILSPGPHDIAFAHPDFKEVRRKVTLKAGQTHRIELDLALDAVPK
jgi:eukaryotic-like serine/threonine-protein kinase